MKPGYKTTEFWLTIIPLLCGVALTVFGYESVGYLLLGGGASQSAHYTRGRTELKKESPS